MTLEELKIRYVKYVFDKHCYDRKEAAKELGISVKGLWYLRSKFFEKYELSIRGIDFENQERMEKIKGFVMATNEERLYYKDTGKRYKPSKHVDS